MKLHALITDMSSAEYHSTPKTYSSSQFKDLLESDGLFVKKHITKEIKREENVEHFDTGTYFHTGNLEPHKIEEDCVVYPGKVRRGKEWEVFQKKHRGKAIVTKSQVEQAKGLINAVQKSKLSKKYLVGKPEVSLFVELQIHNGRIYAPYFGKELTLAGWIDGPKKRIVGAYSVVVKVRADMLGADYISDLKSTREDAESDDKMHYVTKKYKYQLSGALYVDMFSLLKPDIDSFWLIYVSKTLYNSKPYRLADDKMMVGRAQYMWALKRLGELAENDFKLVERPGTIRVLPEERHWLYESDIDLL